MAFGASSLIPFFFFVKYLYLLINVCGCWCAMAHSVLVFTLRDLGAELKVVLISGEPHHP